MKLLSLNDISICYKDVDVLSGVKLDLNHGQCAALVGPSGSGKSTVLHLIAGLLEPNSGTITWKREIFYNHQKNMPPWKRRVGLVFQDLALWPHLSVFEHLVYACEANFRISKTERKKYISSILEQMQISNVQANYPRQLSGGQQQRLAIARVLAMNPEIVLLDEALNQLDQELADDIWKIVICHQEKYNWTLLYVTHDNLHARQYSDCMFKIDSGKIFAVNNIIE